MGTGIWPCFNKCLGTYFDISIPESTLTSFEILTALLNKFEMIRKLKLMF
jgi:hypothetical protein